MNLYEFEGKHFFEKSGIAVPKGIMVSRGMDYATAYQNLGLTEVVIKAQVLSGKRGKNNGIRFCSSAEGVNRVCTELFDSELNGQYISALRIEEKLDIAEEHYMSISYDTNSKQPVFIYSKEGGMDIEDVDDGNIDTYMLDIREDMLSVQANKNDFPLEIALKLWNCFKQNDARMVEINPLVKTSGGLWIAADAKMALDDDAFYRHEEWRNLEPRSMMGRPVTDREIEVKKIDEGEKYYQGTAGKYIEMNGDIAILFSGGGASIANMDALIKAGLKPANYTEYSGNPPREKVFELTKIVLSKPGLRGLWIAGGVANFTNIKETFNGIVDAFDELKPSYPIVVRRAGPYESEGMELMRDCAARNNLNIRFFGKETSMSETAGVLAGMLNN
ncbi:MAG: hypothetical protein HYY51_03790 [Candidatus Magasanikbacteria bacterium]|nr:hypothetical protein [Candidatus Magasanikbacteria bacterium]